MNCYFCNQPKSYQTTREIIQCLHCSQQFKLHAVYTSFSNDHPYLAHIYINRENRLFQIRLRLNQNKTDIMHCDNDLNTSEIIMTLPNLSINLSNAKQKLNTILTFL